MPLKGQTILVTGGATRLGRHFSLSLAQAGTNVVIHYVTSAIHAEEIKLEINKLGQKAFTIQENFNDPRCAKNLISESFRFQPISAIINNAAIFEPLNWDQTTHENWQSHLNINLTTPFFISQAFVRLLPADQTGRIVNILDWRVLRPGSDHLPYTISKVGLAGLTRSLAAAFAPRITVNGLALGAILPPSDGNNFNTPIEHVPAGRWADLDEVSAGLLFLLEGPTYITGEILHIDGGRHLI